jgi:NAD-dependent SIR2 family protein deacetylase
LESAALESGRAETNSDLILNTEILNARNRGDLVIITGAGISVPSGAPDYHGLVRYLRTQLGTPPPNRAESYDKYLGRAESAGFNIRTELRSILRYKQDPQTGELIELQPNEYHYEIRYC